MPSAVAQDTTGARIKYWRLRRHGMSQAVLAGLAGVSQSYISHVESGRKVVDRRSTLVAIAAALRVTVADLLGQPGDPTDPVRADAAAAVPAIWAALIEIEEGEHRVPARTREQLGADIGVLYEWVLRSDYTSIAAALPGLLVDAAAFGGLPLAQVAYRAQSCLANIGYRHLALSAARVAVAAAQSTEDPAWVGISRFAYALKLPIEAAGIATRVSTRAVADLQTAAGRSTDARQALGMCHLAAGFTAAVDGQGDDAVAHLAEAAREAAALGDPVDGCGFNQSSFGPTNVGLWRMAVAAEQGEHGRVIELARTLRPDPLRAANRHQAYWMTLGSALAVSGRHDREALVAFIRAERVAPSTFAMSPAGRDAVVAMARRARRKSLSGDLRVLARRIGIEVTG